MLAEMFRASQICNLYLFDTNLLLALKFNYKLLTWHRMVCYVGQDVFGHE